MEALVLDHHNPLPSTIIIGQPFDTIKPAIELVGALLFDALSGVDLKPGVICLMSHAAKPDGPLEVCPSPIFI